MTKFVMACKFSTFFRPDKIFRPFHQKYFHPAMLPPCCRHAPTMLRVGKAEDIRTESDNVESLKRLSDRREDIRQKNIRTEDLGVKIMRFEVFL